MKRWNENREGKWKTYGLEIARGDAGKVEGMDGWDEDEESSEEGGCWTDGDGGAFHLLLHHLRCEREERKEKMWKMEYEEN
jgi:hypothetical protein